MYAEIHKEVKTAIHIARTKYPNTPIPLPNIKFSKRLKTTGGICSFIRRDGIFLTTPTLTFSIPIIEDNPINDVFDHVVYHEVAHIVAFALFKETGHGYYFKWVMNNLYNKPDDRCHNLKTRNMIYKAHCVNCKQSFDIDIRFKNKIANGKRFTHKTCGGLVVLSNP